MRTRLLPGGSAACLLAASALAGCVATEPLATAEPDVLAINVGGGAYAATDGTRYAPEQSVWGGRTGRIAAIKGSPEAELYRTYREGDVRVRHPLPDGRYDVTLHFAEPHEVDGGERVFDVIVEDERAVEALDVMAYRDGKVRSALSVTVRDVQIGDGMLDVRFEARAGEPVLGGVSVRRPQPRSDRWVQVWGDEFDTGTAPDPARWNIEHWPARKVNDEDQAYTARRRNVRVENGMLVIEAHREDYGDARYTSARIQSQGKGDFLYGRIEARARLPRGQGTWPAIWMLPSDPFRHATNCEAGTDWQGNPDCDAWPNSGEIDIMEHVGYQMNHVHGTVHTRAYYWAMWEQRKGRVILDDVANAFHVYAVEWTPERIDVFVDDTLYFTYVNEGTGWRSWPFDHPFHVIVNLAVGGYWGRAGGPIDDSIFPQRLLVDWVRAYRAAD